jgi:hypothetical protein
VLRRFPQLLQAISEFGPHSWRDVTVDAPHAGHLVPHPLGLEDVPNAEVVRPCLVTMS